MGVVIEICIKYPGGPTRIKGTNIHHQHPLLKAKGVRSKKWLSKTEDRRQCVPQGGLFSGLAAQRRIIPPGNWLNNLLLPLRYVIITISNCTGKLRVSMCL
jgi:hypothetical protein